MTEKANEQKMRIQAAYQNRDAKALGEMVLNGDIVPEPADFVVSALNDFQNFLNVFKIIGHTFAPLATPENIALGVEIFKPFKGATSTYAKVTAASSAGWAVLKKRKEIEAAIKKADFTELSKIDWGRIEQDGEKYGFDFKPILTLIEDHLPKEKTIQ